MNTYQGDLLLLLRLMEDSLSEAEQVRAKKLLADPVGQTRWQLLQQAGRQDPLAVTNGSEVDEVSADQIAAYLEQQLTTDEAKSFESACWQSVSAMCELVSTYRFMRQHKPQAVGKALTNRLMDLARIAPPNGGVGQLCAPSRPAGSKAKPTNGHGVESQARRESVPDSERLLKKNELAPASSVAQRQQERRRPRYPVWLYVAASLVLIVCVGGLAILLSFSGPNSTATQKKDEKRSPSDNESDSVDRFVDQSTPKTPLPPDQPHFEGTDDDENNPPVVNDDSNWQRELDLPLDWQSPQNWLTPNDDKDEPKVVNRPNRLAHKPAKVAWDRIVGVVAAQDESSGRWHGVNYSKQIGKIDTAFASLPDSWAQTAPGQFGQMILAADTEIRIGLQSADETRMAISLMRGRVAIHDLPIEREVTVQVGKLRWSVRAARPRSVVAIDLMSSSPRVFVPRGEALVDGQAVGAKKQIAWNAGSWASPHALNRRENTAWTERPVGVARLRANVQQSLLRSSDLIADLGEVDGLDSHLATRWSLAISPQDAFARMSSPDSEVRVETFRWILSLHSRDRRFAMALRQFVAKAGDPQLVRSLSSLIREARQKRIPSLSDTQQALRGMRHAELAVRHFAAYVIGVTFGTKTKFVADAAPNVRNAQADSVARELQQVYRQASQRSGAATGGSQGNATRAGPPPTGNP